MCVFQHLVVISVWVLKKTQVYQLFMCPGLGTTYRIKNYWVHLFLAGLFSHCTSVAIYIVDGRAYFLENAKRLSCSLRVELKRD